MKTKAINGKQNRINVITMGCSKNLVDSEVMMGQLRANNLPVTHQGESEDFDTVIINTCGFIDKAKEESINTILEYARAKTENRIRKLYVTGCLSHRYKEDLKQEIPEVDAWFGTMELPALLKKFNADYKHELTGERLLTTPAGFAYLKISEGCSRKCAFCAIPLMRGAHKSKPIETILTEAKNLAAAGVKELILIAQELTYYGLDIYKHRVLPQLLEQLSEIPGIEWIRLHYAYPAKFPLELLDIIRDKPNICNYLDIPLQHCSDNMLTAMKRQISKAQTRHLLNVIRSKIPHCAIRTTMMVGFPGETQEDFDELMDFVEEQQFDRLGVFTYSHEENTAAHMLDDNVPEHVKQQRAASLMEVQQNISFNKNIEKINRIYKVMIDKCESGYYIGRTEFDSPEVDNEVLIKADNLYLRIGDFVNVKIIKAEEFDLYGLPIKEPNPNRSLSTR